jgi:hypothetical protein
LPFSLVVEKVKFNPALFARMAAGDGLALIQRCRALRGEDVAPAFVPYIGTRRPDILCAQFERTVGNETS